MEEENLFKENIEKSKKVLKEHFERRKQERMFREMYEAFHPKYPTIELHRGSNWDIDDSEFDNDFKKSKKDFLDKLIWNDKIGGD